MLISEDYILFFLKFCFFFRNENRLSLKQRYIQHNIIHKLTRNKKAHTKRKVKKICNFAFDFHVLDKGFRQRLESV